MINKFMSIGPFLNLIRQKKMMSRCLATTASDPVNYINKYFFSSPDENIDKNKSCTSYQPKAFACVCLFEIFQKIFFELFGRAFLNKIICDCFLNLYFLMRFF